MHSAIWRALHNSVAYAKIPVARTTGHACGIGEMQVALPTPTTMLWDLLDNQSRGRQQIQLKGQVGVASVHGNDSNFLMNHIEEVTATVVTGVTVGGGGA